MSKLGKSNVGDGTLAAEDWWWIDYLENEMDPSLELELQGLLASSQEDRDAFEGYRIIREWLKSSDPAVGLPIEARAKDVRQNVMQVIDSLAQSEIAAEEFYLVAASDATKSLRA